MVSMYGMSSKVKVVATRRVRSPQSQYTTPYIVALLLKEFDS